MVTAELIEYLKRGRPAHRQVVKEIIAALQSLPGWRTDAPPKDRMFLARIKNLPGVTVCRYSPADDVFVWPEVNVEMINGAWDDYYFDTENGAAGEIDSWMELPG